MKLSFESVPDSSVHFAGMRFALIELRILTAAVIKKFTVTSLDTPEKLRILVDVLMSPLTGMHIKLEKRETVFN